MRPKHLCLVHAQGQVKHAQSLLSDDILFLCTNRSVFNFCNQQKIYAVLMDDDMVKREHRRLNSWGFHKTFSIIDENHFGAETRMFLESNFFYIQGLLIQTAKWVLVLDEIIEASPVDKLILFESATSFMPIAIEAHLKKKHPNIHVIIAKQKKAKQIWGFNFKNFIITCLTLLNNIGSKINLWALRGQGKALLVSGAINHLGDTLIDLRANKKCPVVYLEEKFNWDKFKFCFRNGIIYLIGPNSQTAFVDISCDDLFRGIKDVFYKTTELTLPARQVLGSACRRGFLRLPYGKKFMARLFGGASFFVTLLDEDQSTRRALFVYAAEFGVPCYTISHGIPGTLLDPKEFDGLKGRYRAAETFIQSELEREAYLSIYYDPQRLHLTGLPRYDSLYRIAEIPEDPSSKNNRTKILFCGASLKAFDFSEFYPWMGLKNFLEPGSTSHLDALKEALREVSHKIELWIKPHYSEEKLWQSAGNTFVREGIQCKIFSHKANIFDLEHKADLVLTPESTVISESIMMRKPVIVLNFTGEALMAPYNRYPLMREVSSPQQLTLAIFEFLENVSHPKSGARLTDDTFKYYSGAWDGTSAARVSNQIFASKETL